MKKKIWYVMLPLLMLLTGCSGKGAEKYSMHFQETESGSSSVQEQEPMLSDSVAASFRENLDEISDEKEAEKDPGAERETAGEDSQARRSLYVDVSGEVLQPGVYELSEGDRVFHAIRAAGGFTEQAETRSLNQAELLWDGEKIIVYSREEAQQKGGWIQLSESGTEQKGSGSQRTGDGAVSPGDGRINLNRADKEELMTLPGVGESRAEAILSYRETQGAFSSIEEIMQIPGIKEKLFEQIRDKITI
ncbi:MAG: helix-hairpin-helix domain-containing protein [Lachnospiraceae bacterium]|nr:helix-hairpin-helix domain-containing protein [Lachnospiraceae bacterium]